MSRYFTVETGKFYQEGMVLGLIPHQHMGVTGADSHAGLKQYEDDLRAALESRYLGGVSPHGTRYVGIVGENQKGNYGHEIALELVRLSKFPARRSRFQCYFGCETVEDARRFAREFRPDPARAPDLAIWEVDCDAASRADMGCISAFPFNSAFAHGERYWSGESHWVRQPFWEILLEPPITIVARREILRQGGVPTQQ